MIPLTYHKRRVLDPESFLSRFDKVSGGRLNAKGEMQYQAYCPAHETHHQSLAIAISRDGRYLLHCHAGCTPSEVCSAIGLSLADLYPDGAMAEKLRPIQAPPAVRVNEEVLRLADETRKRGGKLSAADKKRERDAWLALRRDQKAGAA